MRIAQPKVLVVASSLAAALFWITSARAQGADGLPPFDGAAPAPPAREPAVVVLRGAPERPTILPVRAERRLALLGELGWNGLAGFGPNLTFHADPHLSFDMGAGLSLLGWKVGARVRYNLLLSPITPFVGVGMIGAAGLGDAPLPLNDSSNTDPVNIKVHPSAFLQTVVGVDWTRRSGFTLVSTVGYAWLLSADPVEVVSGTPTADEETAFDVAFRSSLVLSIALGYSFR